MVSESRVVTASDELHESRLKMRLVGAAVLIALAVIFLPLIFDGAGTESQFRSIESIEMEPPHDLEIFDENQAVELSESTRLAFIHQEVNAKGDSSPGQIDGLVLGSTKARSNTGDNAINPLDSSNEDIESSAGDNAQTLKEGVSDSPNEITAAVRPQQLADNSVWLIQTASFRDKINALSLRSDLKSAGYPVDVRVGEKDGKSIFRVFVGPVEGKDSAKKIQSALNRQFERETLLVKQ